ncbi:MAG: ABC-F family ATP-binding cassette domain-containing protein [Phycisphaerales bacterium]|nr:ABC-F family ATP-binding cassette domain-containing protein [Phycisphaerales bacterium]
MPLVAIANIAHSFGTRRILDGVSLSIEAGERVGVVGRNGSGKSTMLRAMGGLLKADQGSVSLARGCRIGYLQQDPVLDPDETLRGSAEAAFAELHRLHQELDAVFGEMAHARGDALDRLLKKQSRLESQIEAAGGYSIDHKIDAVLHGLGFVDAQFALSTGVLSGGQRARLSLARLLLEEPDVLLLDEPTNHLDLDGRLWLESFLRDEFRGAVVMISHDRYLLDNVVTRIVEVEQGRLIDYPAPKGSAYQTFRRLRAERRMVQLRAWEAQETKFKAEQRFIDRYRAGQRAKQAKGRESKLERAREQTTLERPVELGTMRFALPPAPRSGEIVAKARSLTKRYEDEDGNEKKLFEKLDLTIARGERVGIIGPNGAGKSTLVKCLLGELEPNEGDVNLGAALVVGYFRQTSVDLDPEMPVYRYLQSVIQKETPDRPLSEQAARDLAGAFLFSGDEQIAPLGRMSGGERGRARLAALLASSKNVLVLDEPTNHLDIESAERVESALALEIEATSERPGQAGGDFEGTLLLISHDRAFIDACCNRLIVLDGHGRTEIFEGNYTQWHQAQLTRAREQAARDAEAARAQAEADRKKRQAEIQKPAAKPITKTSTSDKLSRMKTEQLEQRISDIEGRIKAIDASLSDGGVWRDHAKCDKLGKERTALVQELEPLEFEWMRRAEE